MISKFQNKQDKFNSLTVFEKKVLKVIKKISNGRVATYKFVAKAVGRPRASRAIGNVLKKNPYLIKIPCHRVIRSNGQLGGYSLGSKKKLLILKKEGIKFKANKLTNHKKILV